LNDISHFHPEMINEITTTVFGEQTKPSVEEAEEEDILTQLELLEIDDSTEESQIQISKK